MKKLFVLLLYPLCCSADPGPATQYLLDEPATLLDVAMLRLDRFTDEFEKRVGLHWTKDGEPEFFGASVSASYDEDADEFHIYISSMNSEPSESQMKEGCTNAMYQMNIWLNKSMHRLFEHAGYDDPLRPTDFLVRLSDQFEIRCAFSASDNSSQFRFMASRRLGALGSRDISVGSWLDEN